MREYARQAGLRRALIRVPFATPRISGLWLSVMTPVYASIGRELVESLYNDTLVRDGSASDSFPIRPRGFARVDPARARERGPGVRRDPLVGCAIGIRRAKLGRRHARPTACRISQDQSCRRARADVRTDPTGRRRERLVLRKRLLAATRPHRQAGRRRRSPPRTPRPDPSRGRRHTRLLAGRGI